MPAIIFRHIFSSVIYFRVLEEGVFLAFPLNSKGIVSETEPEHSTDEAVIAVLQVVLVEAEQRKSDSPLGGELLPA